MVSLLVAVLAGTLGTGTPPVYDPATETRVAGRVAETRVEGSFLLASLIVEGEALEVFVAPPAFLLDFEFVLEKGDRLTVVGSRVRGEGPPRLVAKEVTKGTISLILRDERGRAAWEPRRP
jgi:hypothetical protein